VLRARRTLTSCILYCFRIRLRLDPRNRIGTEAEDFVLADGAENARVVLLAHGRPRLPLSEASQLVLSGEGYASEAEAEDAASRWVARLRVAFAGSLMGADFGLRAPSQRITPHGLEWIAGRLRTRGGVLTGRLGSLSGRAGRAFEIAAAASRRAENSLRGGPLAPGSRVLHDVHGPQVFECRPPPVFATVDLDLLVKRSPERFRELVAAALEKDIALTEREELAFELFSGSFFEPTADGRFLLLMMAVEALTVVEQRSKAAAAHIDELVATTQAAALTPEETESLANALRMLKRESISRAGQRLAQSLGSRTYLDQQPPDFFKRYYSLRSRLVHGNQPYPSFDEVNSEAGALELFVRDYCF
jgi:hypothetical protein